MDGEFDRDSTGLANALPHPFRKHEVMAVAGAEVASGLRDADDWLA
jgi:hypothetical protein